MSHLFLAIFSTGTQVAAGVELVTIGGFALLVAVLALIAGTLSFSLRVHASRTGTVSDLPRDLALMGIVFGSGAVILGLLHFIQVSLSTS